MAAPPQANDFDILVHGIFKRGVYNKDWQKRCLVIYGRDNLVHYVKDSGDIERIQNSIDMSAATIYPYSPVLHLDHHASTSFEIITPQRTYYMHADCVHKLETALRSFVQFLATPPLVLVPFEYDLPGTCEDRSHPFKDLQIPGHKCVGIHQWVTVRRLRVEEPQAAAAAAGGGGAVAAAPGAGAAAAKGAVVLLKTVSTDKGSELHMFDDPEQQDPDVLPLMPTMVVKLENEVDVELSDAAGPLLRVTCLNNAASRILAAVLSVLVHSLYGRVLFIGDKLDPSIDHYGLLGVQPGSSQEEIIESAARTLKRFVATPPGEHETQPQRVAWVTRALTTLLDPEQRAKFDNFLAAFAALQALRFHLSGALVTRAPKPQLPPETRNYMDAYVSEGGNAWAPQRLVITLADPPQLLVFANRQHHAKYVASSDAAFAQGKVPLRGACVVDLRGGDRFPFTSVIRQGAKRTLLVCEVRPAGDDARSVVAGFEAAEPMREFVSRLFLAGARLRVDEREPELAKWAGDVKLDLEFGRHGYMQKRGKVISSYRMRFFRTQKDATGAPVLDYYEDHCDIKPRGTIKLAGAVVDKADALGLNVAPKDVTDGRVFALKFSTEAERDAWSAALVTLAAGRGKQFFA